MKPFAYLVERHAHGFPAQEFIASLSKAGLNPEKPLTGEVFVWSDEGNRLRSSRTAVVTKLCGSGGITFELWFPHGVSLLCSFQEREEARYSIGLDLWGLERRETEAVEGFVIDRFRATALISSAILMVFDSEGATADFDWYDLASGAGLPAVWPRRFGLSEALVPRAAAPSVGYLREIVDGCVLFSK